MSATLEPPPSIQQSNSFSSNTNKRKLSQEGINNESNFDMDDRQSWQNKNKQFIHQKNNNFNNDNNNDDEDLYDDSSEFNNNQNYNNFRRGGLNNQNNQNNRRGNYSGGVTFRFNVSFNGFLIQN